MIGTSCTLGLCVVPVVLHQLSFAGITMKVSLGASLVQTCSCAIDSLFHLDICTVLQWNLHCNCTVLGANVLMFHESCMKDVMIHVVCVLNHVLCIDLHCNCTENGCDLAMLVGSDVVNVVMIHAIETVVNVIVASLAVIALSLAVIWL